jgi:hypothetical protein
MENGGDGVTRDYVLQALGRYWPRGSEAVGALPIPRAAEHGQPALPPPMEMVELPQWAKDVGVEGGLLVPAQVVFPPCCDGAQPAWTRTDWLRAAHWHLDATAERAYERRHGPIDSYSFRLAGWDARIWRRAWVNRIALFLRRWAARQQSADESRLLGPLPRAELVLTHDVDAVAKTAAIRLKQSAFHLFNSGRFAAAGRLAAAAAKLLHAGRFLLGPGRYWRFEEIVRLEDQQGSRSHFNFYGGPGGRRRTWKEALLDPAYCVEHPRLAGMIRRLRDGGWTIGLHPSFQARDDARLIRSQRERLERVLGGPVTSCRQHWLRFSWQGTWQAQQAAGLRLDTTLGFNDRPGFRNAAALCFHPWCHRAGRPMTLEALPTVLMDSQLYDYQPAGSDALAARMAPWLEEVRAVGGCAALLWHSHTLSDDYGWGGGFRRVLQSCKVA